MLDIIIMNSPLFSKKKDEGLIEFTKLELRRF